jgi:hypothetical protein
VPWKWYSIYEIDPNPHTNPKNLSDDEIDNSIRLLKQTANVHDTENFPNTTPIEDHRNAVKAKADAGFLVIAYQPRLNAQRSDDTLYFQYGKTLSGPHVIDETSGTWNSPPFSHVWVVSHGLDPDPQNFPGNADVAFSRGYIRGRLTASMRRFMTVMGVDRLYSVDWGTPDANPTGRRIGKLQVHGNGDQWEAAAPIFYRGSQNYHQFWGGTDGEFRLTRINDRGT